MLIFLFFIMFLCTPMVATESHFYDQSNWPSLKRAMQLYLSDMSLVRIAFDEEGDELTKRRIQVVQRVSGEHYRCMYFMFSQKAKRAFLGLDIKLENNMVAVKQWFSRDVNFVPAQGFAARLLHMAFVADDPDTKVLVFNPKNRLDVAYPRVVHTRANPSLQMMNKGVRVWLGHEVVWDVVPRLNKKCDLLLGRIDTLQIFSDRESYIFKSQVLNGVSCLNNLLPRWFPLYFKGVAKNEDGMYDFQTRSALGNYPCRFTVSPSVQDMAGVLKIAYLARGLFLHGWGARMQPTYDTCPFEFLELRFRREGIVGFIHPSFKLYGRIKCEGAMAHITAYIEEIWDDDVFKTTIFGCWSCRQEDIVKEANWMYFVLPTEGKVFYNMAPNVSLEMSSHFHEGDKALTICNVAASDNTRLVFSYSHKPHAMISPSTKLSCIVSRSPPKITLRPSNEGVQSLGPIGLDNIGAKYTLCALAVSPDEQVCSLHINHILKRDEGTGGYSLIVSVQPATKGGVAKNQIVLPISESERNTMFVRGYCQNQDLFRVDYDPDLALCVFVQDACKTANVIVLAKKYSYALCRFSWQGNVMEEYVPDGMWLDSGVLHSSNIRIQRDLEPSVVDWRICFDSYGVSWCRQQKVVTSEQDLSVCWRMENMCRRCAVLLEVTVDSLFRYSYYQISNKNKRLCEHGALQWCAQKGVVEHLSDVLVPGVSADHRRSLPPRVLIEGVEHMAELLGMMHGRLLAWKLGEGRTLRVAPSEMFSDKGALCADEYVGETLVASHIVCKVDALRDHGRKRKSHEIAGAANPKKVYTVCPLDL